MCDQLEVDWPKIDKYNIVEYITSKHSNINTSKLYYENVVKIFQVRFIMNAEISKNKITI